MKIIKFDEQGNFTGPVSLPFSCTEGGATPGNIADPARVLAIYQANGYVAYEGDPECNTETHRLGGYYLEGGVGKRELVRLMPEEIAANLAAAQTVSRAEVKATRQEMLDRMAKSAGVSAIYGENRRASELILADQGDSLLLGSVTATQFATDAGVRLGMTAAVWAGFIKAENDRERLRGKRVEEGYLHFYYGAIPAGNLAVVLAAPGAYRAHCEALMAAANTAEILAVPDP